MYDLPWLNIIHDFGSLVETLVNHPAYSRHKLKDKLNRDLATIRGWLRGSFPVKPTDVGWIIRLALQYGIDISRFQTFNSIYDFSPLLTYEKILEKPIPDFSWLTPIQSPPPLNYRFGDLKLDSPIGIASSPLVSDERWTGLMLDLGFGLSTFKTRRTGPRDSFKGARIAFVLQPPDLLNYDPNNPPAVPVTFDQAQSKGQIPNMINSFGVPSESAAEWQDIYERIKNHPRGCLVGISVMGEGESQEDIEADFALAVEKARDVHPPFVELNLSCPSLKRRTNFWDHDTLVLHICAKAQEVLRSAGIPLVVKLPYLVPERMETMLRGNGPLLQGVSFHNTIRVRPITVDAEGNSEPAFLNREFGGLSGPCTFRMTKNGVEGLCKIREKLHQDFRIIAVGGVATPSDVSDLLNSGADIVQACTAPMFDPLLAWKVRFHLIEAADFIRRKQLDSTFLKDDQIPFLAPRDEIERESQRYLDAAVKEIKKRTRKDIPYVKVRDEWNLWMNQRSDSLIGDAHHIRPARSKAEWIRRF